MDERLARGSAYGMLCVIWGSTWLAIKIGLEGAPAFLSAFLRFVVASATLLLLAAVLRSRLPRGRGEWGATLFVGVVLFTFDYGLIYWGENNGVGSGLSAILFATMPLQTALVAHVLLQKERFTGQKAAGILLGFAGMFVIFRTQLGTADAGLFFPMLAIVLSATCASFATVVMKRWAHEADAFTFNGIAMGVGAAGLALASVAARETWAVPSWPEGILAILYLGLVGSVVTFVAWLWLLRKLEATVMSFVAMITPIVAVFLGVTLGSETFEPLDLLGAAVTLAGIYVSNSNRLGAWARSARANRSAASGGNGRR